MSRHDERELWRLRFQKILQLEEESFEFYKALLREKGPLLEEAGIQSILEQILHDEGKHIRIAKDLVRLIREALPDKSK